MSRLVWMMGIFVLAGLCAVREGEAELLPHAPILIAGDESFTEENGVVGGSGTQEDPYLISGLIIDASGADYGISIESTTKIFQIENCRIIGAKSYGIRLVSVDTASVHKCWIERCFFGVALEKCDETAISENTFVNNEVRSLSLLESGQCHLFNNSVVSGQCGIWLGGKTTKNLIHDNVLDNCGAVGIWISNLCDWNHIYYNDFINCRAISDSINRWDDEKGVGNYWSRYSGEDKDQDGIGDASFSIYGSTYECDYHPAMQPFHWEETD